MRGLAEQHRVGAVGLAIAGFVDPDRRTVAFGAHLPWRDDPVAERLAARLDLPVVIEHDANAAGLAEHRVGAAAGASVAVLVALGTGIGAALLVDGAVFRGAHGVAPELGHLTVVRGGRPCPCGKRGCLERYCSGTALGRSAEELVADTEEFSVLRATWERAQPITGWDVRPGRRGGRRAGRAGRRRVRRLARAGAVPGRRRLRPRRRRGGRRGVRVVAPCSWTGRAAATPRRSPGERTAGWPSIRPATLGGRAGMVGAALDARERSGV